MAVIVVSDSSPIRALHHLGLLHLCPRLYGQVLVPHAVPADLLLVDERKATAAAHQLGLTTIGVLGVLLETKRRRMVDAIIPLVDRLVRDLRFFFSPALRKRLAELAGE